MGLCSRMFFFLQLPGLLLTCVWSDTKQGRQNKTSSAQANRVHHHTSENIEHHVLQYVAVSHHRVEHEGKSLVLGGDGIPCETLDAICKGADAYVQTVIRADLVSLVKNKRFLDILDYHSTVEQAAQTATRAGVKKLILTHYVPSIQPGQEEEWRALAAAHFAGEIVLGDDLTATTI